jgi:hypothetical protein
MTGWLADALADFLDNVTERGFDAPFLAILRACGHEHCHQLHGNYEFGKDFISQSLGPTGKRQWMFQSKAGNINLSAWQQVRLQLDEMRTNSIAHPAFNTSLPKVPVLVTTGRLVGGAGPAAQQYDGFLRSQGEGSFEVWDRERLLELLMSSPEAGLVGWNEPQFLAILDRIESRSVRDRDLEVFSRSWLASDLWRAVISCSIVASGLMERHRVDLSCQMALGLIRAAAAHGHGRNDEVSEAAMDAARSLFLSYGDEFRGAFGPVAQSGDALCRSGSELFPGISYPVRCYRYLETMGMLGLLHMVQGEEEKAGAIARELGAFVRDQRGASHPLSDRWAVSLIPASLLLFRFDAESLRPWIEAICVWIADHHWRNPALGSVAATPEEETAYLVGPPFEHVELRRRKQSYVATILLDLTRILGLNSTYDDLLNDFLAVELAFPVFETSDGPGQYVYSERDFTFEPSVRFEEHPSATEWAAAAHHRRGPDSFHLQRLDRYWEHLAISLVLRDRHFISTSVSLAFPKA